MLHLAADVVATDSELAWRLVARAKAVKCYKIKQNRLRELWQKR